MKQQLAFHNALERRKLPSAVGNDRARKADEAQKSECYICFSSVSVNGAFLTEEKKFEIRFYVEPQKERASNDVQ